MGSYEEIRIKSHRGRHSWSQVMENRQEHSSIS